MSSVLIDVPILCSTFFLCSIAREIAGNGPLAIGAAKSSILQGMDAPTLSDALEIERKYYQAIIPTEDRLEGLAAFREKRKPEYRGG